MGLGLDVVQCGKTLKAYAQRSAWTSAVELLFHLEVCFSSSVVGLNSWEPDQQMLFLGGFCSVVIWDREIVQRVVSAWIIPGDDRWDVYNLNTSFILFQKLVRSERPYKF